MKQKYLLPKCYYYLGRDLHVPTYTFTQLQPFLTTDKKLYKGTTRYLEYVHTRTARSIYARNGIGTRQSIGRYIAYKHFNIILL